MPTGAPDLFLDADAVINSFTSRRCYVEAERYRRRLILQYRHRRCLVENSIKASSGIEKSLGIMRHRLSTRHRPSNKYRYRRYRGFLKYTLLIGEK